MKIVFSFDEKLNRIVLLVASTRMLMSLGEGGSEIKNQGRSDNSKTRFSQETGAIGQRLRRIRGLRPKQRVLSAGCTVDSDSSPHFFYYSHSIQKYKQVFNYGY